MKINNLDIYILFIILLILSVHSSKIYSESLESQVSDISKELMCPVCRGQTVSESNSELAKDFRDIIRKKLEKGESKEEILNYFTSRYGDTVLASPPAKGFRLFIWLLPLVAIITGFIILSIFLKSRSRVTTYEEYKEDLEEEFLKEVDEELKKLD